MPLPSASWQSGPRSVMQFTQGGRFVDSWPGTVIAGMAFGVSFSTFAIAEWRNRRARRAERIKNLLGDRSTIAYAAIRILDEGLPRKTAERTPVIEAIIHACIFEGSDRARALLYQVIDHNRQYRNEFDAALQRVAVAPWLVPAGALQVATPPIRQASPRGRRRALTSATAPAIP